jgi:hypothetical protein
MARPPLHRWGIPPAHRHPCHVGPSDSRGDRMPVALPSPASLEGWTVSPGYFRSTIPCQTSHRPPYPPSRDRSCPHGNRGSGQSREEGVCIPPHRPRRSSPRSHTSAHTTTSARSLRARRSSSILRCRSSGSGASAANNACTSPLMTYGRRARGDAPRRH